MKLPKHGLKRSLQTMVFILFLIRSKVSASEEPTLVTLESLLDGSNGFEFIEFTMENIKASMVKEWYEDWTITSQNHPGWKEHGEVSHFGRTFLRDADFFCGISFTGCNKWPVWHDILHMYPHSPEHARRIYFAMKAYNHVNAFFMVVNQGARWARVSASEVVESVVVTFTEQENQQSHETCKLITSSLTAASDAAIGMVAELLTTSGYIGKHLYPNPKSSKGPVTVDKDVSADTAASVDELQPIEQIPTEVEHGPHTLTEQTRLAHLAKQNAREQRRINALAKKKEGRRLRDDARKARAESEIAQMQAKEDKKEAKRLRNPKWEAKKASWNRKIRKHRKVIYGTKQVMIRWFPGQIKQYMQDLTHASICDAFGGSFEAHNEEHTKILRNNFDDAIDKFLSGLGESNSQLNMGVFRSHEEGGPLEDEDRPSQLSSLMFRHELIEEAEIRKILANPTIIEEKYKKQYIQLLASSAGRLSGCYIKCNTQADALNWCHDTDNNNNKSRFCPKPDKVCQVQCHAQWVHSKELELHGIRKFADAPFHLDLQTELHSNYERFLNDGNQPPLGLLNWYDVNAVPSMYSLPVCDSDAGYIAIGDLYKFSWFDNEKKRFPASCGNWRSDETAEFFRYAGLDIMGDKFAQGQLYHFYDKQILLSIEKTMYRPLDTYLVYCELGIAFPTHHLNDSKINGYQQLKFIYQIQFHPSEYCDTIKEITKDMGHEEANVEFCTGPEQGPLLESRSRIDTDAMNLRGVRHLCHDFISDLNGNPKYKEAIDKWWDFEHNYWYRGGFH